MSTVKVVPAGLELTTGESYGLDPNGQIVLTVLDGWVGGGTFRRSSTARLNGHGEFSERGYKGAKILGVQGDAVFDSRQEAAQFAMQLEATLAEGQAGRLTVIDEDLGLTRWIDVYLTAGVKIDQVGADVEFIFDLIAPDPFKRGAHVDTLAAGDGSQATATGAGTADAELQFILTGYFPEGFTITEAATGNVLRFTGLIDTGAAPLTIDAATGVVMHGSQNLSTRLTGRQWTQVKPGQAATFQLGAPGAGSPTLTVRTTPTWH